MPGMVCVLKAAELHTLIMFQQWENIQCVGFIPLKKGKG